MTALVALPERVQHDLGALAGIVDGDHPGWTRVALTDQDTAGREWVRQMMRDVGLEARIDPAGNVIGVLTGTGSGRSIMIGSHTDTVAGGGRFDGIVGVAGALEVVRLLAETGTRLAHDLIVADFFSEEPNRFGLSCIGSRAFVGALSPAHLQLTDTEGRRFGDSLHAARIDASGLLSAAWPLHDIDAFLELHIEQGPHLEQLGSQIGLVDSITGVSRFHALFAGRPDHAGTTPMSVRADAGCAAAGTILAVERIASEHADTKGTSGALLMSPHAVNVVTATAEMRGEFRGPDAEWLARAQAQLTDAASIEAARRGVSVEVDWLPLQEPAPMDAGLLGIAAAAADDLGLVRSTLFSGAEHDAAIMSRHIPAAMLFVPSHDGRSHCPEEWTELDDVCAGITALAQTLVRADLRNGS